MEYFYTLAVWRKKNEDNRATNRFEFNKQQNHIYPNLIILNNELTLVDTGYSNPLPLIDNEIFKNRYEVKNLKNIIITHYICTPIFHY
ncbi:hypothetical protein UP17_11985 [Peribacillus simplex]|nr:hypothetical protein UP17_11985 [Peribacillus simplex]